ncbi:MAG: hypothetical protein HFG27_04690 [Provencibacterium sp.]|jgi:uncharacterized protein YkwD|nr:hypothetical protein [Provencibacterium sp.]
MVRMKKSITALCTAACLSALFAAPAYAGESENACPNRSGLRLFSSSRINACPDLEGLLALLKKGDCSFSFQLPSSCPEILPPETQSPPDSSEPDSPLPPADTPEKDDEETKEDSDAEEAAGLSSYEAQVVSLVNAERKKAGLSALKVNSELTKAARIRCQEQTVSFSHTRPNGARFSTVLDEVDISYMGAGENIAYGQRSAEEVMESWMNSPGHRANILREEYTEIGVGCYQDTTGRLYWTQLFIYA